jgi:3-phosphoshikimate 1-carboxyvinyltransferase
MEYPSSIRLYQPRKHLSGRIALERSKSLSNRALIIRALSGERFPIHHLSGSADTRLLEEALNALDSGASLLDAGAGGTTFRFLAALLAFHPGVQTLTGSERMLERPVGPLVEALRRLGARIDYLGKPGFPPLRIGEPELAAGGGKASIASSVSSQFISALLLVGPSLPEGLHLELEGPVVSRPYIDMTLGMMRRFGAQVEASDHAIRVFPGAYAPQPFEVEADWSAASYFYAFAALSESSDLLLEGLREDSLQGDAVLAKKMRQLGVETHFEDGGARLLSSSKPVLPFVEWDFLPNPDLAQTIAVLCAAKGIHGLFSGLETLRIKETDRIAAMQQELQKVGVWLTELPARLSPRTGKTYFQQEGQARWDGTASFSTYDDHRMAMALSALGFLGPIRIEAPGVVEKSYPHFWEDLNSLGFVIEPAS